MTNSSPASMGEPLSEAERALNAATRAIATNMQRWHHDSTVPVDYFACDARELIDVGDDQELLDSADRLLSQGDFDNGTLVQQIAEAPDAIRRIIAQVGRLGADLFDANARVGVLEGQLATARHRHRAYPDAANPNAYCLNCLTGRKEAGSSFPEYVKWPCPEAIDLGLDGGGSDGR